MRSTLIVLSATLLTTSVACAGWQDDLNKAVEAVAGPSAEGSSGSGSTQNAAISALGETEIVEGLKEALAKGTERAILSLGQTDGYWTNELVQIALPDQLQSIEKPLKQFGGGAVVDEFHMTLNRAAEKAIPDVADIFGNAIRALTLDDARSILNGPDNAATEFFKRSSMDALTARVRPLVEQATDAVGVTGAYKNLVSQAGPLMMAIDPGAADLDGYVTEKALDGLFTTLANEESEIRQNPAARTTDILERVFGGK